MWYTYTMDYYTAIKKNEPMSFAATWMHLEIIILREARERQMTETTHIWSLIFKNDTKELIYKTETDSQKSKPNLQLPDGKCGGGGINQALGADIDTLLCINR